MQQHEIELGTRRGFLRALAAGTTAALASGPCLSAAEPSSTPSGAGGKAPNPAGAAGDDAHARAHALLAPGDEQIAILIYPGFTAIDAVGPHYFLAGMTGAKVALIARKAEPVPSDAGYSLTATASFQQCPEKLSLFLVVGGTAGTLAALEDAETLKFVRSAASRAKLVGSVCTGSLVLGAAGLLRGYKATSHWQTLELLSLVGATPTRDRVVFDRDRVTAAGVTAGLDVGLELVRRFRGDAYCQGMQLMAQYDPKPPFPKAGNPETADPQSVGLLNLLHKGWVEQAGKRVQSVFESSHKP